VFFFVLFNSVVLTRVVVACLDTTPYLFGRIAVLSACRAYEYSVEYV
jgi:hypothetical protein